MEYTVIWRDNGDDFMFTEIRTLEDERDFNSTDWVLLAAEVEYADWSDPERAEAIAEIKERGYELLDVVKGKLESVL